jgi:hypothetical protein
MNRVTPRDSALLQKLDKYYLQQSKDDAAILNLMPQKAYGFVAAS